MIGRGSRLVRYSSNHEYHTRDMMHSRMWVQVTFAYMGAGFCMAGSTQPACSTHKHRSHRSLVCLCVHKPYTRILYPCPQAVSSLPISAGFCMAGERLIEASQDGNLTLVRRVSCLVSRVSCVVCRVPPSRPLRSPRRAASWARRYATSPVLLLALPTLGEPVGVGCINADSD
jgi:hypothetical protein